MAANARGRPKTGFQPFSQQSTAQKSITRKKIIDSFKNLMSTYTGGEIEPLHEVLNEMAKEIPSPKIIKRDQNLMDMFSRLANLDPTYNQGRWTAVPAQIFGLTRKQTEDQYGWHIGRSCMFFY